MDQTGTNVPEGTFTPKSRFKLRIPWRILTILMVMAFAIMVIVVSVVQMLYASRIQSNIARVQNKPIAIVLGASVKRDHTPSDALRDRILSAVELYDQGFVDKILMSGDDGEFHIDEISVMIDTAMEAGVPSEDIWSDGHGYRTYESCSRAIHEYQITEAVIVTQRFHIARALFLCNQLGIDAIGYVADKQSYERNFYFWARDLVSSAKAFWDIYIQEPTPPVEY
jgi:vancomycin permeability regulator SanA